MTSPATGAGDADPDGTAAGATAGAGTDPAASDPGALPARTGLGRSSMIMASGTFASRVLGVVNSALLGWAIGLTGSVANAFSVANKLPNTLYLLIAGGVLNAVLVPQVVRAYRRPDGQHYVDRLLTVGIVLLGGLAVVLTAAAPLWVRFYSQFADPRVTAVATALAFWCIPQVFFYGLYSLLGQVLNARGSFGPYMWAPVINNVVFIAGLLVLVQVYGTVDEATRVTEWSAGQTAVLGAAATLGIVAQALVLLVPLYRSGFRYRPRWGLRGSGLGSAGRVATWTFLGLLIGQVGVWRISVVASSVGDASNAGNAVYDRAFLIFMLPHSLATVGIAVLSTPLARAMFPTEPDSAVEALALVVVPLVCGLVPFGVWSLCQRVYYAYEDARSMVPVQVVMAVVVVGGTEAGRWLLDDRYWVAAACASMAVSYLVGAGVALVAVRRRLGGVDGRRVLVLHAKAVVGGLVAGAAGLGLLAVLGPVQTFREAVVACVLGAVVMSAVYAGVLALLRVGELRLLVRPVLRLVGRGR
jgi:putative peptidoglycan lipid II flippase